MSNILIYGFKTCWCLVSRFLLAVPSTGFQFAHTQPGRTWGVICWVHRKSEDLSTNRYLDKHLSYLWNDAEHLQAFPFRFLKWCVDGNLLCLCCALNSALSLRSRSTRTWKTPCVKFAFANLDLSSAETRSEETICFDHLMKWFRYLVVWF